MDNFFRLVGEVTIPENKKDEFNSYALELLDMCGLRKIKTVEIAGVETEVASHIAPNDKGIVEFDYSVFEKIKREISSYNMNTCELTVNKCGLNEFGYALMLLLILQESYSETECYLCLDKNIIVVNNNGLIIESILGNKLRFPYRADLWGKFLFFRKRSDELEVSSDNLLLNFPSFFERIDYDQFLDVLFLKDEDYSESDLNVVEYKREQFAEATGINRRKYLYSAFMTLLNNGDKIEPFLEKLIKMSINERRKEAKDKSLKGDIAELSLCLSAQTLIRIYALAASLNFWDVWNRITSDGFYKDHKRKIEKKDKRPKINFHDYIERDSEDEFIGIWKDRKLGLTKEMKTAMRQWRQVFQDISAPESFDMEQYLTDLISDIREYWDIRIVDEDFIEEFIEHRNNIDHQKAIMLIRSIVERYVDQFPELTRRQALDWVIAQGRTEFDSVELEAVIGIMTDHILREKTLGF
ncbi:MAG: hypothetical protein K6A90_07225 [Lachnospiraceae bacterium]|nr:hypothetical protein [Lachnospiraceae bacterium]